jgi:hypothetical protein
MPCGSPPTTLIYEGANPVDEVLRRTRWAQSAPPPSGYILVPLSDNDITGRTSMDSDRCEGTVSDEPTASARTIRAMNIREEAWSMIY